MEKESLTGFNLIRKWYEQEIAILVKGRITPMINTSVYHLSPNTRLE
jgi:hypothetical protein